MNKARCLFLISLLFAAGCLDYSKIGKPSKPDKPDVVNKDVSASLFFESLADAVERGDFKDSDRVWTTARRAAKNAGLDFSKYTTELNEHIGDISENTPLEKETDRKDLAARIRRLALALK